jgi:hypothetical protein
MIAEKEGVIESAAMPGPSMSDGDTHRGIYSPATRSVHARCGIEFQPLKKTNGANEYFFSAHTPAWGWKQQLERGRGGNDLHGSAATGRGRMGWDHQSQQITRSGDR